MLLTNQSTNCRSPEKDTMDTVDTKPLATQASALQVNPLLVEMKKAETWNGALPSAIYSGAPIPFMQVGK